MTLLCCLRSIPRFSTIELLEWANLVLDDRSDSCSICTHILASRWPNIIFLRLCATLSCSIDYGTPKSRTFPFRRTHGPLSFAENANSITARITRLEWTRNRSNHAHSCRLGSWRDFSDFFEFEKGGCWHRLHRPRPGKEANPTTRIIPLLGQLSEVVHLFSFDVKSGLVSAGYLSSVRKVEPQRAQFQKKSIAWSCQGRTSTCRDSL